MEEFFSSTTWIIISAIISVFGLIGTILGIYQYVKSSKQLREYMYLFKVAGQHVDLEDKKNQINDYKNQITDMQKTIREQIPEEAKKIALRGILDNELQVLSSTYTKVKSLQSELEVMTSEDNEETEELMKKVNKVIEPTYSLKRSNNIFSTVFYLISIVSSFLSMILPYEIYKIIIIIVLLLQLIIGARTMVNTLKSNYTRKELSYITNFIFFICSIGFLFISTLFLILLSYFTSMFYHVNIMMFLIVSTISFCIHVLFGILYFKKTNTKHLVVWLMLLIFGFVLFVVSFLFMQIIPLILGALAIISELVFLLVCHFKNRKKKKQI